MPADRRGTAGDHRFRAILIGFLIRHAYKLRGDRLSSAAGPEISELVQSLCALLGLGGKTFR